MHTKMFFKGQQCYTIGPNPLTVEDRLIVPQSIDPNVIIEVMKKYFGIQLRPLVRSMFRKPYPHYTIVRQGV